jgi:hypothetical protein
VSIILAIKLAQVEAKALGDSASLQGHPTNDYDSVGHEWMGTHAIIVAFPSLLKIRRSDCMVTLGVTTSGF